MSMKDRNVRPLLRYSSSLTYSCLHFLLFHYDIIVAIPDRRREPDAALSDEGHQNAAHRVLGVCLSQSAELRHARPCIRGGE